MSRITSLAELRGLRTKDEPKQERSKRTKRCILMSAATIFAERGFQHVTLQDVAESANLTKGAVYFHFKNKEDLALAVIETQYSQWDLLVTEVLELDLAPLETLFAFIGKVTKAYRENVFLRAVARLQVERFVVNMELPEPYLDWTRITEGFIEECKDAKQLRAEIDTEALAQVIVSCFFGIQPISDAVTDRRVRCAEMRDIIFAGLRT